MRDAALGPFLESLYEGSQCFSKLFANFRLDVGLGQTRHCLNPRVLSVTTGSKPRAPKYPVFEVSGSPNHILKGFWNQKPQTVGTWTLHGSQGLLPSTAHLAPGSNVSHRFQLVPRPVSSAGPLPHLPLGGQCLTSFLATTSVHTPYGLGNP